MEIFSLDNTEGYTQNQLDKLNEMYKDLNINDLSLSEIDYLKEKLLAEFDYLNVEKI